MEALTAEQVAQVVTFLAPGFAARLVYTARFRQREPGEFTILVLSVVASLPLVAVTNAVARRVGIAHTTVTALPYVALLLGVSVLVGYLVALLRGWPMTRNILGRLGLAYQPEESIYAQTMLALPPGAAVTIEFTDGRKLSGTPRIGPGLAGEEIEALCLTHPAWWDPASQRWREDGAGGAVIVPL